MGSEFQFSSLEVSPFYLKYVCTCVMEAVKAVASLISVNIIVIYVDSIRAIGHIML